MARPQNKTDLLQLGEANFHKLLTHIDSLSPSIQSKTFPAGYLNRNIRDVLAHIHEWHLMLLTWHKIGMTGTKPHMPAPGFSWKTLPELNKQIQQQYEHLSLSEAIDLIQESYKQVRATIDQYSDMDLFEKKRYTWTGSTSMGAYFISATSSHYDWGLKLIKKCLKK